MIKDIKDPSVNLLLHEKFPPILHNKFIKVPVEISMISQPDNNLCPREKGDDWWRRNLGYHAKTESKGQRRISEHNPRDRLQIEENHDPEADEEKRMRSVRNAIIEREDVSAARAVTKFSFLVKSVPSLLMTEIERKWRS